MVIDVDFKKFTCKMYGIFICESVNTHTHTHTHTHNPAHTKHRKTNPVIHKKS